MKKIMISFIVVLLATSLCACGEDTSNSNISQTSIINESTDTISYTETETSSQTLKITDVISSTDV